MIDESASTGDEAEAAPTEGAAPDAVEPSEPEFEPVDPTAPLWVKEQIGELDGQTVEALQELASNRGISGYSGLNKRDLIKAIAQSLRDNPPPEPRIG